MATLNKGYYSFYDTINFMAQVISESINFTCDNVNYSSISFDDDTEIIEYGAFNVYDNSLGGWLDNKYKKILLTENQNVSSTIEALITSNSAYGFTLVYNSNGGESVTPHQSVSYIGLNDLPTITKVGGIFLGWYYDSDFTNRVNEGDLIDSNTTIYAKWKDAYRVDFNTDGGTYCEPLINVDKITSLPTTQKTNFTFSGWYYDLAYTQEVHINDSVTSNITVYAKWIYGGGVYATFYNNSAEKNRVDKYNFLSNPLTTVITLLRPTSIKNPIIDVEYSSTFDFNYIYIPTFNRFYYISEPIVLRKGLYRLECKVDVLMSFKNTILQQQAYISRQEFNHNDDVNDNELIVENEPEIKVKELIGSPFDNQEEVRTSYVITVARGE